MENHDFLEAAKVLDKCYNEIVELRRIRAISKVDHESKRKSLKDFNNNYQAYANYLESAECANDDGYSVFAEGRNVYTPTDGDWTKGHGHFADKTGLGKDDYERKPDDEQSKGRPWYSKWLK